MEPSWQCGRRRCCLCTGGLEAHSFQTAGTTLKLGWRNLFEQDLIQICLSSTHTEQNCNFSSRSTELVSQTNQRCCDIIWCHLLQGRVVSWGFILTYLATNKSHLSHILKFNIYCLLGSLSISLDRVSEFLHMILKARCI